MPRWGGGLTQLAGEVRLMRADMADLKKTSMRNTQDIASLKDHSSKIEERISALENTVERRFRGMEEGIDKLEQFNIKNNMKMFGVQEANRGESGDLPESEADSLMIVERLIKVHYGDEIASTVKITSARRLGQRPQPMGDRPIPNRPILVSFSDP